MNIVIFKELTTNEHLAGLKVESEKYTGLYVDMNESKQRKYVKDKADDINQLIKKVERYRIDASKEYKLKVEKEAASIIEDLEIANMPFTLLIDEYKEERKKILDAEKAERERIEFECKLEGDHEFALLMDDKFNNDRIAQENERLVYEQKIKDEAALNAKLEAERVSKENELRIEREKQDAINKELRAKQDAEDSKQRELAAIEREKQTLIKADEQRKQDTIFAENKRLADIELAREKEVERQKSEQLAEKALKAKREANKKYLSKVHTNILNVLKENGIDEKTAKLFVTLAAKNKLPQLTINY